MPITLTVSTSSLNLMAADCKQVAGAGQGDQTHRWEGGGGPGCEGEELGEASGGEETGRMGEDGGEAERVLGQGWGALG